MTAIDKFGGSESLDGPLRYAEAVTPHDDNDLIVASRCLYVGSGGNITVVMLGGGTFLLENVNPGATLPIRVTRVKATGTDATGIVSFY